MSKFFRSADSSSTSSSEPLDDDEEDSPNETDPDINAVAGSHATVTDDAALILPASTAGLVDSQHKDLLLHALLEERCLNQARNDFAGRDVSQAEIKAAAYQHYRRLCARLAPYGLVAAGLDHDLHQSARHRYRDGLDMLSQDVKAGSSSLKGGNGPQNMRLISDGAMDQLIPTGLESLQLTDTSWNGSALNAITSAHSSFNGSRYEREFEEVDVLGKGGYGVVYHCKHRLDGCAYAVKKVPLSANRLEKIQARGQAEVDELLRELTTLAQLDHPNVVRYYGGWIEWTSANYGDSVIFNEQNDAVAGAFESQSDANVSFGPVGTNLDQGHILFEDSRSRGRTDESTGGNSPGSAKILGRTVSHGTQPTVSEDDVESISRSYEPTDTFMDQSANNALASQNGRPRLALHIQMALYPMTLADFLSTGTSPTSTVVPLKHCFHHKPSIHILLAVLDGVAYLHRRGILHRDIKPGNIFLGPKHDHRSNDGSVDLFLCDECRENGTANPVAFSVRIGDFGLVTAIAKPETKDANVGASPVGTELYRPTSITYGTSPALDLYAIGIIAFELLWPFATRMERHATIQSLKQGNFPPQFSERVGYSAHGLQLCIERMLATDTHTEASVEEIRQRLVDLI